MSKLQGLRTKLEKGVAHFTFQKANGEHREAFGTTNGAIIPKFKAEQVEKLWEESRDFLVGFGTGTLIDSDEANLSAAIEPFIPKPKKESTPRTGVVTFFDIEKQAWRSCKEDSVLTIL